MEVSICDSFSPPLLQCSFPFISFSPSFPVSLVLPFPGEHFPFAGCHKIRGPSSLSLSLSLHLSLCRFCLAGFVPPSPVCQPPCWKRGSNRTKEKERRYTLRESGERRSKRYRERRKGTTNQFFTKMAVKYINLSYLWAVNKHLRHLRHSRSSFFILLLFFSFLFFS